MSPFGRLYVGRAVSREHEPNNSEERTTSSHTQLVHNAHHANMASRLVLRPLTRVRLTTRFSPTHIATRSVSSAKATKSSAPLTAAKQRSPKSASPSSSTTPVRGASTAAEIEAALAAEAAAESAPRGATVVEVEPLDAPLSTNGSGLDTATDWSRSYHGLSTQPFPKEVTDILLAPIDMKDVEIKPGTCLSFYPTVLLSFCLSALFIHCLPAALRARNSALGTSWHLTPHLRRLISSLVSYTTSRLSHDAAHHTGLMPPDFDVRWNIT